MRPFAWRLTVIVTVGVGLRAAYLLTHRRTPPSTDGFLYLVLAVKSVARGHGFVSPIAGTPTAFHPPAWPLVLALPARLGLTTMFEAQVFALGIGTVTVVLVALAGRAAGGERVGLVAATIALVYPNIWIWERELASETLVLPLVALAILLAYTFRTKPRLVTLVALAVTCAALALTRAEQVLVFFGILVPLVITARRTLPRRRVVEWLAIATGSFVLALAPWVGYNFSRFDRPVILTTSLGSNLRMGNDAVTYRGAWLGGIDFSLWRKFTLPPGDESQVDAHDRHVGINYARAHSSRLPLVVAAREGRTWSVFNVGQQSALDQTWGNDALWLYRVALVMFWLLAIAAVAGCITLRRRRTMLFPLLVPFLIVAIATAITYGEPRYRASAEVPLVLLAAVGIEATLRYLQRRRSGAGQRHTISH